MTRNAIILVFLLGACGGHRVLEIAPDEPMSDNEPSEPVIGEATIEPPDEPDEPDVTDEPIYDGPTYETHIVPCVANESGNFSTSILELPGYTVAEMVMNVTALGQGEPETDSWAFGFTYFQERIVAYRDGATIVMCDIDFTDEGLAVESTTFVVRVD